MSLKRSLIKTVTWRLIGSLDTFVVSYLVTGTFTTALSIGSIDLFTKMILYFVHEVLWNRKAKSGEKQSVKKSLIKTFTWRVIGSLDTFVISLVVGEALSSAATIGGIGFFTKSTLYFFHEMAWSKIKIKSETND
ncbi:MAG: hypothetical protein COA97_07100 [Flavobacteriales bacterium]|nr:MAG: hypothetical protein COA97_07100 [Flavobacteriales bacterium]